MQSLPFRGLTVLGIALLPASLPAQPADLPIPSAVSTTLPPGISVRKTPIGDVYVDARGHTLYGMDMRGIGSRATENNPTSNWMNYCSGPCTRDWQPVTPPPGTPPPLAPNRGAGGRGGAAAGGPPPDWTMVETDAGPQLMYKASHLVFVRKGEAPGSVRWDGHEGLIWNALRYIPPAPKLVAPPAVASAYIGGAYALVDKDRRVLYTCAAAAACRMGEALKAPSASQDVGAWTVSRNSDTAQWLYRGKPVFIGQAWPNSASVPAGAVVLRPDRM